MKKNNVTQLLKSYSNSLIQEGLRNLNRPVFKEKNTTKRLMTLNAFKREHFDSVWIKRPLEKEWHATEILPEGPFNCNDKNVIL